MDSANGLDEAFSVGMNVSASNFSDNATITDVSVFDYVCAANPPTALHLFYVMPWPYLILYLVYFICALSTLLIFLDDYRFISKAFRKNRERGRATIWFMAVFPVFSITAFVGTLIPRSGAFVDFCANAYFGTCFYQLVRLMTHYMGGRERVEQVFKAEHDVALRSPPCCCCCCCLGTFRFTRRTYLRMCFLVWQMAIVRPFSMFLSAVLWLDDMIIPGQLIKSNGATYISVIDLISSLVALYGLVLMQQALTPYLQEKFKISHKINLMQGQMAIPPLTDFLISILVTAGVIPCNPVISSASRGKMIHHGFVVVLMLVFAIVARKVFRNETDATEVADLPDDVELDIREKLSDEVEAVIDDKVIASQPAPIYRPVNNNEFEYV